jgi:hypothetical protein
MTQDRFANSSFLLTRPSLIWLIGSGTALAARRPIALGTGKAWEKT